MLKDDLVAGDREVGPLLQIAYARIFRSAVGYLEHGLPGEDDV
jgi:hypothetical protein